MNKNRKKPKKESDHEELLAKLIHNRNLKSDSSHSRLDQNIQLGNGEVRAPLNPTLIYNTQ